MAITYNEDGSVRKRKGDKKAIAMGKEFFGVPKDVREANKRLSGKGPFDVNDQKKVIDYYKKLSKNKKGKA
jgi:hypothetical protein|tara:strand:- start:24 stop:236 length:213 start_codon:yes stop_codon:yes gene_type:complete